ncbi:MAG TPA: hypothetical protein PKL97_05500 [Candidatus Omnitrophota bacterium]|nr:hypothetical protein [Candidatus Omnitrophota bacterium]
MEKDFLIAGIRKQCRELEDLITELDEKQVLTDGDWRRYDDTTKQVERDLRYLRRLSRNFFEPQNRIYF